MCSIDFFVNAQNVKQNITMLSWVIVTTALHLGYKCQTPNAIDYTVPRLGFHSNATLCERIKKVLIKKHERTRPSPNNCIPGHTLDLLTPTQSLHNHHCPHFVAALYIAPPQLVEGGNLNRTNHLMLLKCVQ